MCLVIAIVVVGCTKSPTSPPKTPPAKDSGPQRVGGSRYDAQDRQATVPAATVEEKPAADDAKPAADDTEAGRGRGCRCAGSAKPDMTPPADVAPPAPKLPFEDLVAALGNEHATEVYRQIEQQLAQNPRNSWLAYSLPPC